MQKRIAGLLFIAFLSACAMPETRIYSLNMPAGTKAAVNPEGTVAVIVSSPRYLAQPYIAYRTSPYQLAISRYAKWDAPPDDMVADAFRDSLSATLFKEARIASFAPTGAYALNIALKHFERLDDGNGCFAEVAFDVSLISPEGKTLYQSSFAKRAKLDDRSFLGLAKGTSGLLGEGTEEAGKNIAKAIKLQPLHPVAAITRPGEIH